MGRLDRRKGENYFEWRARVEAYGWQGWVGAMIGALLCLALVGYAANKGVIP